MKVHGNQIRKTLVKSGMEFVQWSGDGEPMMEVILADTESGNLELWVENDNFAGYVIEIYGIGYGFVCEVE